MSSDRTVFVLGAGASKPYGLPLGDELFQLIVKDFGTASQILHEFLNAAPFNQAHVDKFIGALRYSGFTSVDEFLEKREEFVDVGKAIMTIELLAREKGDALWDTKQNWMQHLYGKM